LYDVCCEEVWELEDFSNGYDIGRCTILLYGESVDELVL
jgi:hypothetical protein